MLGAHSGRVSCCSQAQYEIMAMVGVWLGAGATAQCSRDAQGAAPGSAAQHPAFVTVTKSSLSAQTTLDPTTGMGQPLPSQGLSLSRAAHLKLKKNPK